MRSSLLIANFNLPPTGQLTVDLIPGSNGSITVTNCANLSGSIEIRAHALGPVVGLSYPLLNVPSGCIDTARSRLQVSSDDTCLEATNTRIDKSSRLVVVFDLTMKPSCTVDQASRTGLASAAFIALLTRLLLW